MHLNLRNEYTQASQMCSENSQPQPPSASELENKTHPLETSPDIDVAQLRAEFDRLLKVKDRLKRDYLLIRQAKASDIETATYREMFKAHRERKVHIVGAILPFLRSIFSGLGKLAIVWGLILFVMEADSREEAAHNESWKILNEVKSSEPSSAGRIGALQTLAAGCAIDKNPPKWSTAWISSTVKEISLLEGFFADCVSLRGLDARNAHLAEIKLKGAQLNSAQLQDAKFWQADLRGVTLDLSQLMRVKMNEVDLSEASLKGAQMEDIQLNDARLRFASMENADLSEADLTKADLFGADLSSANLKNADLSRAILEEADLRSARLSSSQLLGENAPLLCRTQLPEKIKSEEIDQNRDCLLTQQTLKRRYSNEELKVREELKIKQLRAEAWRAKELEAERLKAREAIAQ